MFACDREEVSEREVQSTFASLTMNCTEFVRVFKVTYLSHAFGLCVRTPKEQQTK